MPKTKPPRSNIKTKIALSTPYLSVVVPLLDEEDSLRELYQQIVHSAGTLGKPFEMIFIDDGSTDNSFGVLKELHAADARVKVVRFRRNFGKSAALSVGFHEARGNIYHHRQRGEHDFGAV